MIYKTQKGKIFYYAKKVFYENGLTDATIKQIADEAETTSALVLYHYKSKQQMVTAIYSDFYRQIIDVLNSDEELRSPEVNSLYRQILISYMYYGSIINDKNNIRFYKDVAYKYSILGERNGEESAFTGYLRDFNLVLSKKDLLFYSVMRSGARFFFFRYYLEQDIELDLQEIVYYVESIMPKLIGIDQKTVDSWFIRADHKIKEIDYSNIKFLI